MSPASPHLLHQRITSALQAGALTEGGRLLGEAPNDTNFDALRGIHAQLTGNHKAALDFFDAVLAKRPQARDVLMNKVKSLTAVARYDEAVAIVNALNTDMPGAATYVLLSEIYDKMKEKTNAVDALGKAIERGARAPELVGNYWMGRRDLCLWDKELPDFAVSEITPAVATVLSTDPVFQRRVAEYFCTTRFPNALPAPLRKPTAGRRIRLGYISADIHKHATAYLIAELFALHDQTKFETFCFSYGGDDKSDVRQRIIDTAEHFIDVKDQPLPKVVEAVRREELDILVDLKGHTRNHALAVLAHRPAPVQIHYLGHPGTIGGGFIDYLVGDDVVTPAGSEEHYTEHLIRVPGSYQINDRQKAVAPTLPRSVYGLPENAVVLAVFNQTYKITPEMFALWMQVMRARPETVLWLFESVNGADDNLRAHATATGIDPARLHFAKYAPLDEHLARYRTVDIVMDTHPYGGHTTTSDALWAGTPVVTLAGRTYPSRVAASLLTNVGLADLITETPGDYVNKVIALIDAPDERQRLRDHLNKGRDTFPLFDTPRWVKNWEQTLLKTLE